jgi:hypothetical protein
MNVTLIKRRAVGVISDTTRFGSLCRMIHDLLGSCRTFWYLAEKSVCLSLSGSLIFLHRLINSFSSAPASGTTTAKERQLQRYRSEFLPTIEARMEFACFDLLVALFSVSVSYFMFHIV